MTDILRDHLAGRRRCRESKLHTPGESDILNLAIMVAVLIVVLLLWSPKVQRFTVWRAMTTPLASIIGSGFFVLGPILDAAYGKYAPLAMAALCLGAYLYGGAIRSTTSEVPE